MRMSCRFIALALIVTVALAVPALAQEKDISGAGEVIDKGVQVAQAGKVNPCAAKNPCAAAGKVDPKLVTRPKGTKLVIGDKALGERLWKDTKLSTNGMACATCHTGNANFNATFTKSYPHLVAMAKERGGVKQVNVDEMVQFCMVVPMAAKPLPWDSKELAALSAYTLEAQKGFKAGKGAANPCAGKK